eukprot:TRINITY_DN5009_c0_g1_i2.p1 TRINITY_DN5009_c0_g1~~TRINITY_DN5009_c0_g1_i2.p1  ORF type:complete len:1634 (+),score=511.76 TRINITY_DN5009_c0_g1_i2:277-4902(+)
MFLVVAAVEVSVAAVTSDWDLAPAAAALVVAAALAVAASLLRSVSPATVLLTSGQVSVTVAAFVADSASPEACLTVLASCSALAVAGDHTASAAGAGVSAVSALVAAGVSGDSFAPAARLCAGMLAIAAAAAGQRRCGVSPACATVLEADSAVKYKGEATADTAVTEITGDSVAGGAKSPPSSPLVQTVNPGNKHSDAVCDVCYTTVTQPVVLCQACRQRPLGGPPSVPSQQSPDVTPRNLRRTPTLPFSASSESQQVTAEGRSPQVSPANNKKLSAVSAEGFFVSPMPTRLFGRPGDSINRSAGDDVGFQRNEDGEDKRESTGSLVALEGSVLSDGGRPPLPPASRVPSQNRPPPIPVRGIRRQPTTPGGPETHYVDPPMQPQQTEGLTLNPGGLMSPGSARSRASLVGEIVERKHSRSWASQRSRSLCSDGSRSLGSTISRSSSIASAHGSYVSFVAQVRREPGVTGGTFALAARDDDDLEPDYDEEYNEHSEQQPAAPERQPSYELRNRMRAPSSKRRISQRPPQDDKIRRPSADRRSVNFPAADRSPLPPFPISPQNRQNRVMSLLHPNQPRTAEETKEATKETRELVKSVVELDFSSEEKSALRPFQTLPMSTLQKLVVLFGRLSEELEIFRVQQFIVAAVCEVMQCDRAAIFLAEWKNHQVHFISDEGQEIRVPMEGSLAGYAAIHRKVLNIKDAYSDPRFNKDVDRRTGYTTRNLLVYPIGRGVGYDLPGTSEENTKEVIAVIEAINKHEGPFTAEDENVLALLGKQAGIHMSNAQTHQQLQLQGLKAQTLLEVSKEIADIKIDLGEMMARIMSRARQVLTVERASIFLIDEDKQELWSILTDQETAAQLGGDNVIRFPVGVGLAGHVASTGNVLNIPDTYKHPLFNPEFDQRTGFVTRTTLCVPIRGTHHGNKVMGVMQFINKNSGEPFMEEDEELALSFSSFVAISLNNILLYDELREGQLIREKNKELEMLRDQAQQAAEAKSNFLMAMSHEIRTPMGGVIGMCELLQNTDLSAEQVEMTDTIRSCGEALMAIINDVLDYGKLESGKLELEQRDMNLVSMMEETVDVIRSKTEAKAIALVLNIAADLPVRVVGDEYRLRQVLTNLLGNAVKFTPVGGDITLYARLRKQDDPRADGILRSLTRLSDRECTDACNDVWVYFCVQDTGIGITEEAQGRLFRPFEQAEAGTTRQFGGSGLGLAICRQLVDAMGGTIGIVSRLGEGSSFWFTVRFSRGDSPLETLSNSLARREEAKILLACSHLGQQRMLRRIFDLLHAQQRTVSSLSGLLDALRGDDPAHLVIVDEALDGMEVQKLGGEVADAAKQRRAQLGDKSMLQVVPMASMATKSRIASNPSFPSVLSKPPKIATLTKLIDRMLQVESNSRSQSPAAGALLPTANDCAAKLLIAEDNPTNQLLFKKQLQGFSIVPTMCDNGQIAVDRLKAEFHDLVFMDCHMPVLDGYGAARKIRLLEQEGGLAAPEFGGPRRVTIVALTADALPDTRGKCTDAGMDDYITKPLRKATLQQVLETYFFKAD